MKTFLLSGVFFMAALALRAQNKEWLPGGAHRVGNKIICNAVIENGDTIPYLTLAEVEVKSTYIFKTKQEAEDWRILKDNVKKVYPMAVLAGIKFRELNTEMNSMKTEHEKRVFMKKAQRELEDQFEKDLKGLYIEQGRLLILLISRETGTSTYEVIRDLRGTLNAFMWQSFASAFYDSSLKLNYEPEGKDRQIEAIIHLIEDGQI